jgi:hypothetical protein
MPIVGQQNLNILSPLAKQGASVPEFALGGYLEAFYIATAKGIGYHRES